VRISDILAATNVLGELTSRDREGVLRELATHLTAQTPGLGLKADEVLRALMAREKLGSTGVGDGVAIPHAKMPGLTHVVACLGRAPAGIDFDAIDHRPVTLFFLLLAPESSAGVHLKALARVARLLKVQELRQEILGLPDGPAIYRALLREDAKV